MPVPASSSWDSARLAARWPHRMTLLGAARHRAAPPRGGRDRTASGPSRRASACTTSCRRRTSSSSPRRTRARRAASSAARELSLMSRDAILVNVSRGQLVDEPALIEALRRRHDRRCRPRCVRRRAPAAREPVLDAAERPHHAAHVRLPARSLGRRDDALRREPPSVFDAGRAAPQRGRQAGGVLELRGSGLKARGPQRPSSVWFERSCLQSREPSSPAPIITRVTTHRRGRP